MSSIFGSPSQSNQSSQSQSQSSSQNLAYPMLSQALGGQITQGTQANGALGAMLGLGGDQAAQAQAFNNFKNSTGYQQGLTQGVNAITGSAATRGLLNSGSTAKAVDTYGQNYADSQYQNYTNLLQGLNSTGNQAAGIVGGTGQVSNSMANSASMGTSTGDSSKEASNKMGFLGALL